MKFIADPSARVILSSAPNIEEARRLAQTLLERRLVACVNILPGVESEYRWRGQIESASEILLLIKTTRDREDEVFAAIQEIHSYEVPEAISLPIFGGLAAYVAWLHESVSPESQTTV